MGEGSGRDSITQSQNEDMLDEICDEQLEYLHDQHDFEVTSTARAMGISRQSLYRRIEEHPNLWLINDLSDSDIREEMQRGGTSKRNC